MNELIGHRRQIDFLTRAVESGVLPHALLFFGPQGVGKRTIACVLTKSFLCSGEQKWGGCGVCGECRAGNFVAGGDTFVLDGSQEEIKIEDARTLQRFLAVRPRNGERKAVIVDGAHHITQESSNALLKTLEEPSGDRLMIFVTSQPDRLPNTVRSRLMQVFFGYLGKEDMERFIGMNLLTQTRKDVLMFSEGSPGKLIRLFENPSYLEAYRELQTCFSGAIEKGSLIRWEELSEIGAMPFAEKLEYLSVQLQRRMSEHQDARTVAFTRALLERLRAIARYNLNERLLWESLMAYI